MSRFRKLSHALWCCEYHIIWVPKYRYRILTGPVGKEVHNCIRLFCVQKGYEMVPDETSGSGNDDPGLGHVAAFHQ